MGEEQDVPRCGQRARDHLVGARPYLAGGLAPGHTVCPERPSRTVDPDVDGAPALVVPVVPLEEVVGGLGLTRRTRRAGRSRLRATAGS